MNYSVKVLALVGAGMLLTGCVSAGQFIPTTALTQDNFRVVQVGAKGQSYGGGFICLPGGPVLLPLGAPSMAEAKKDLYAKTGFPSEQKARALANVTIDLSSLCLFVLGQYVLTITADVVEFTRSD